MTDYISREAAIESFRKNLDGGYVLTNDAQTTHILQSIPASDVRPVVLCKDCKHWAESQTSAEYGSCDCDALLRWSDFYCANGAKREES